jgi:hypothetical protein
MSLGMYLHLQCGGQWKNMTHIKQFHNIKTGFLDFSSNFTIYGRILENTSFHNVRGMLRNS